MIRVKIQAGSMSIEVEGEPEPVERVLERYWPDPGLSVPAPLGDPGIEAKSTTDAKGMSRVKRKATGNSNGERVPSLDPQLLSNTIKGTFAISEY